MHSRACSARCARARQSLPTSLGLGLVRALAPAPVRSHTGRHESREPALAGLAGAAAVSMRPRIRGRRASGVRRTARSHTAQPTVPHGAEVPAVPMVRSSWSRSRARSRCLPRQNEGMESRVRDRPSCAGSAADSQLPACRATAAPLRASHATPACRVGRGRHWGGVGGPVRVGQRSSAPGPASAGTADPDGSPRLPAPRPRVQSHAHLPTSRPAPPTSPKCMYCDPPSY